MNSMSFCVPLTKHEFGDATVDTGKSEKNIERNILNLTENYLNDKKINLRIRIIAARHSSPW